MNLHTVRRIAPAVVMIGPIVASTTTLTRAQPLTAARAPAPRAPRLAVGAVTRNGLLDSGASARSTACPDSRTLAAFSKGPAVDVRTLASTVSDQKRGYDAAPDLATFPASCGDKSGTTNFLVAASDRTSSLSWTMSRATATNTRRVHSVSVPTSGPGGKVDVLHFDFTQPASLSGSQPSGPVGSAGVETQSE